MISRKSFLDAPHGRRFLPVVDDPKVPAKQVLDLLNDPKVIAVMVFASEHKKKVPVPALGEIVEVLEQVNEIDQYFRPRMKVPSETLRFRQFVGMAVRLAMEHKGFRTTGTKGYIGTASKWFTRAEIYARA